MFISSKHCPVYGVLAIERTFDTSAASIQDVGVNPSGANILVDQ